MIRIAFLHRERCHKRADTDSVFSHTIFHCACSFLSLSVIWWLLINISYGIINLLHKGNFNIYSLCIIVHGFFVSKSWKKNYSWISCKLNYLPWYERVNGTLGCWEGRWLLTQIFVCFLQIIEKTEEELTKLKISDEDEALNKKRGLETTAEIQATVTAS